jgi:adenylylsulfate kinase-like enzyme
MIYWFTGQPGHGKTVLAKALKAVLELNEQKRVFHIDGDDLRDLLVNKDYSQAGRENNIRTAQSIALYLHNQGHSVVVSLVAPYRTLREDFKSRAAVTELYVHTTEQRGRESYYVSDYEPPLVNYIEVDTTNTTVEKSLEQILLEIYG